MIREVFADRHPQPTIGADPFSLADPATVDGILTAAGFTDVNLTSVHEPVCYGPDTTSALHAVLTLQMTKQLLAQLDAARADRAIDQLRAALAVRDTGNGVYFDSRAWLITARRTRHLPPPT